MKQITLLLLAFTLVTAFAGCKKNTEEPQPEEEFAYGADLSLVKKLEDFGAVYNVNGTQKKVLTIFKENGFKWARLRIFHTPNNEGPVCNSLDYTVALAKMAKAAGFRIFLDFHYSDAWADPGKQYVPAAWNNLAFNAVADSVRLYTKKVLETMGKAGVMPEMVQVGNEINNGMIWPYGKLYTDNGITNWKGLTDLIKAGITGVKETSGGSSIKIMIHAATGGSLEESKTFYGKMTEYGVDFDVIGLSYYPWWHGTFDQLEANLAALSKNFSQNISLVETAYYCNGYYPEPSEWVLDVKPYPPTEQGQHDFMVELATRLKKYPKVKSVFYWEPETVVVPNAQIHYLGRSLFDEQGNALKGISAWN
jgi:arabinogalactan endo-1,4-beta-galactosidase